MNRHHNYLLSTDYIFVRAQKTQRNRQFRTAVRANQTESTAAQAEMVSYIDCENFQVDLQLVTGT